MVFDVGEVPETSRKRPLLSIARTPLANRKKLFTTETKRPGVAIHIQDNKQPITGSRRFGMTPSGKQIAKSLGRRNQHSFVRHCLGKLMRQEIKGYLLQSRVARPSL